MNRKEIAKKFGDKLISIIWFGSVAKGKDNIDSDIDILIITKKNLQKGAIYRYSELSSVVMYPIYNRNNFAKRMAKEGVVL